MSPSTPSATIHILPAELFVDRDHPMRKFARIQGYAGLVALQDESTPTETIEPLPPLKGGKFSRPLNTYGAPEAPPEPPPRPV